MISDILRIGLVALVLCALTGTAVSDQPIASDTQIARVPSWMWPSYNEYKKKPHYRAMACATIGRAGHCSWGWAFPTAEYAAERVLERCESDVRRYPEFGPCKLRFLGDIDVHGLKGAKLEAAIRVYQLNPNATKKDLGEPPAPPPIS